jgi:hypothetical protein
MNRGWPKPRSRRDFLTEGEIGTLRQSFCEGRKADDAAGEVNCSTRVVTKYYAKFRGGPLARGRPRNPPPLTTVRPSRFYKSNFEL